MRAGEYRGGAIAVLAGAVEPENYHPASRMRLIVVPYQRGRLPRPYLAQTYFSLRW